MGELRRLGVALLLSSAVCLAYAGVAMGQAKTIFHLNDHDALFAIAFDGKNGIAVGDFGLRVETADGGVTWTRRPNGFGELAMFSVVRKQGHCIAVGQQGAIFRSNDCRTWQAIAPVTASRILAVDVNESGVAYAVGGFGMVLMSIDWGKSWQRLAPDWKTLTGDEFAEPHLYAVHVDANGRVLMTGEFGLVLQSLDGGASWTVLQKGTASLFALHMQASGLGIAVGQEGTILRTTNYGSHWQKVESGTSAILTGISATADGQAVATGINTILRSRDSGQSWKPEGSKQSTNGSHHAVATSTSNAFYSVGSRGEILFISQ